MSIPGRYIRGVPTLPKWAVDGTGAFVGSREGLARQEIEKAADTRKSKVAISELHSPVGVVGKHGEEGFAAQPVVKLHAKWNLENLHAVVFVQEKKNRRFWEPPRFVELVEALRRARNKERATLLMKRDARSRTLVSCWFGLTSKDMFPFGTASRGAQECVLLLTAYPAGRLRMERLVRVSLER